MQTADITYYNLGLAFLLLVIPVLLSLAYGIRLIRPLFSAVARMTVQLLLIGVFLKYLFILNSTPLNICWLFVMIFHAVRSAVKNSMLHFKTVLVPAFISFTLPTFGIVLFLNYFVIGLSNIFSASYLVILSGMLLGNSLRGNIVGISHFYESLRKNEREYLFRLGLGISKKQALLPFLTQSVELALKPSFAAMATMGIVALPGMMTGVILGGASPEKAIKYQIMIMIAIVVSTISSVIMTLLLTGRTCFDEYGILKKEIFIDDKSL